jgi:hypothetical protein
VTSGIRERAAAQFDVFEGLVHGGAGIGREQSRAREEWVARLADPAKADSVFELEVLLKGLACFANARNHPGPPRRGPMMAQDFREPTALVREALARVVRICRALLTEREGAFVFQRYLETVMPDDGARARLVDDAGAREAPDRALVVLRQAMANVLEVTAGIARLPRVPHRLFDALLALGQREAARNACFRPSRALEFRPELDRLTSAPMLELIRTTSGEPARRLVALTVLSLFRMLRYLALVESAAKQAEIPKRSAATVALALSVLRSESRALTGYLRRRSGAMLAADYDADIFRITADELAREYPRLLARGHGLRDLRSSLEGLASNLSVELRRSFERDFPALHGPLAADELLAAAPRGAAALRTILQNAVMLLGRALGAQLDGAGVFDDDAARRVLSERLRRDVWMFAEVVRAFVTKARSGASARTEDWNGDSPLDFVREFVTHFRAMGYPLLRSTDYPRVDAFVRAISELHHADLLDAGRVATVVEEAERFQGFLIALFEAIGRRDELAGTAFDRDAADESLRLYVAS